MNGIHGISSDGEKVADEGVRSQFASYIREYPTTNIIGWPDTPPHLKLRTH